MSRVWPQGSTTVARNAPIVTHHASNFAVFGGRAKNAISTTVLYNTIANRSRAANGTLSREEESIGERAIEVGGEGREKEYRVQRNIHVGRYPSRVQATPNRQNNDSPWSVQMGNLITMGLTPDETRLARRSPRILPRLRRIIAPRLTRGATTRNFFSTQFVQDGDCATFGALPPLRDQYNYVTRFAEGNAVAHRRATRRRILVLSSPPDADDAAAEFPLFSRPYVAYALIARVFDDA